MFKELNIADIFVLRYNKTADGKYQQTYTPEEFDQMQEWLDRALGEYTQSMEVENNMLRARNERLEKTLAQQEQGEPVAWMKEGWGPDCGPYIEFYRDDEMGWRDRKEWTPLYTTPQPAQKPLMLEKFSEMKALLDDSNAPQHKTITDDELKIIMETTMPVIDWKARYGVELNNGERNKWMLEWFIAFARVIEAAHGIKE